MSDQTGRLSKDFLEQQRKRLEDLRRTLLVEEKNAIEQERMDQQQHGNEAEEFEDAAQAMAQQEVNQGLRNTNNQRISDIERALQKLADGTYGFSDLSG